MVMKLIIIVAVFVFSYADNYDVKKKKKLMEALNVSDRCGGWGKEIENMKAYNAVKKHCYLTFRLNVLCCIEKPDCPDGLVPETPIFPNLLYPIETLELGCVEKMKSKVSWYEDVKAKPTGFHDVKAESGNDVKKKTMT